MPSAQRDALCSNGRSRRCSACSKAGSTAPHFTGAVHADGRTVAPAATGCSTTPAAPQLAAVPEGAPLIVTLTDQFGGLAWPRPAAVTARVGQALLFVLTILLAGMLLSQLIEEKSNKVIEMLAAAVPVDAIFLGKLFAMLAMSLIGIAVWAVGGRGGDRHLVEGRPVGPAAARGRLAGLPGPGARSISR